MADFTLGSQQTQGLGFLLYNSNKVDANKVDEITYSRGFELWNSDQIQLSLPPYDLQSSTAESASESSAEAALLMRRGAFGGDGRGGLSCQDCGNQAKKDCTHSRCRTCCKTRGFHCPTHVKSTWVPVAKRRDRQQQLAAAITMRRGGESGGGSSGYRSTALAPREGSSGGGGETSKRPREITTAATITHQYGRGLEMSAGSFPPEVSQSAMFRCVRVSSVDEAHDEYAYQTAVNIGGHVFKGILYDHGPDVDYSPSTATAPRYLHLRGHGHESSSSPTTTAGAHANVTDIATTIGASVGGAENVNVTTTTAALLDNYPTPLSAFMAGTQFFPHHPRH